MSPLSRFAKIKRVSGEFIMSSSKKEIYWSLKEVDEGHIWCSKRQKLGEQLTVLARASEEFVGSGPSKLIMSAMKS